MSTDDEFHQHEFVKRGGELKKNYLGFLNQVGIRNDLLLIEYPQPICLSAGYNFHLSQSAHASIFMSRGLYDIDPGAFGFILKHEAAHIKYNDVFMGSLAGLIFLAAVSWSLSLYFSFAVSFWVTLTLIPLAHLGVGGLYMNYRERRADAFAIKHSTTEELKGGLRYFSAIKAYQTSVSAERPQYTRDGEVVFDYSHPTLKSRIERLCKEIEKREGSVYIPERSDLEKHMELLKENEAQVKKILFQDLEKQPLSQDPVPS